MRLVLRAEIRDAMAYRAAPPQGAGAAPRSPSDAPGASRAAPVRRCIARALGRRSNPTEVAPSLGVSVGVRVSCAPCNDSPCSWRWSRWEAAATPWTTARHVRVHHRAAIFEPTCAKAQCHSTFKQEVGDDFGSVDETRVSLLAQRPRHPGPQRRRSEVVGPRPDADDRRPEHPVARQLVRMPYDEPMPAQDIDLIIKWIGTKNALGLGAPGAQCEPERGRRRVLQRQPGHRATTTATSRATHADHELREQRDLRLQERHVRRHQLAAMTAVAVAAMAGTAAAYPQFQLSRDQTCTGCHLSPAGGGLLNENGTHGRRVDLAVSAPRPSSCTARCRRRLAACSAATSAPSPAVRRRRSAELAASAGRPRRRTSCRRVPDAGRHLREREAAGRPVGSRHRRLPPDRVATTRTPTHVVRSREHYVMWQSAARTTNRLVRARRPVHAGVRPALRRARRLHAPVRRHAAVRRDLRRGGRVHLAEVRGAPDRLHRRIR